MKKSYTTEDMQTAYDYGKNDAKLSDFKELLKRIKEMWK